jgi:hypothetical protein
MQEFKKITTHQCLKSMSKTISHFLIKLTITHMMEFVSIAAFVYPSHEI